jgi:G3E family GTPase
VNADAPPWPTGIVTGMLGSGKTTLLRQLLRHREMAATLVLVNEFGEVGLDHHLMTSVTDAVVLLPNGCLCCTVRHDIVRTLRDIHRSWLAGTMPDFGRILIETSGLAEPAPLVASLRGHPVLAEFVDLRAITTLVDAQYGPAQLSGNVTCRNQIRLADHLVISKGDLVPPAAILAIGERLAGLNPLASVRLTAPLPRPDLLFAAGIGEPPRSSVTCDEASAHLDRISTLVLRAARPLSWTRFRIWVGRALDDAGDRILRVKGCVAFADQSAPVVIQAVHHSFYPVVAAPPTMSHDGDSFLVLIFDGPVPPGLEQGFARCVGDRSENDAAAP